MIAEIVLHHSYTNEQNVYQQGLNVVLAHDSNARFPLAIQNIIEQNFYNE